MMDKQNLSRVKRPIIIVGCTRSGTKLMSRVVGGYEKNYLITEHREKFHIPEDKSGICECYIWWNNFEFEKWGTNGHPLFRTPIYNKENIAKVKDIFLKLAKNKRLVIKNPQNILRVPILKEMFPEALFIFCVRNPWHGLQSRVISGTQKYYLISEKNYYLPNDALYKAVYSWKESIDIYEIEKDENWIAVRYEDMVFRTEETVRKVFDFLDMRDEEYFKRAIKLPRDLKHTYYPVKRAFYQSKYQQEIMEITESGCKLFNYSADIESVPGDALPYYLFHQKISLEKPLTRITAWLKRRAKAVLRFCHRWFIRRDRIFINKWLFAAEAYHSTTLIVKNEVVEQALAAARANKQEVTAPMKQMHYYRLKHWQYILLLDEKHQARVLVKKDEIVPTQSYNYLLKGKILYIHDLPASTQRGPELRFSGTGRGERV